MIEKKLLTEWLPFEYTPQLVEQSRMENSGKIIMKGILQKANTLNQNGRIYPLPILTREIQNYQKFIRENRALGECDHPAASVVELKNSSHIVRSARMDNGVVYGTVELLNTPSGKILQSLVESGVTLGISSRGVGSTRKQGEHDVVQDDFQLICFDFVSEPSTPGAFMMREGRLREEKMPDAELRRIFNRSDRVNRIFNDILGWERR
jgi:hypothetical protein